MTRKVKTYWGVHDHHTLFKQRKYSLPDLNPRKNTPDLNHIYMSPHVYGITKSKVIT